MHDATAACREIADSGKFFTAAKPESPPRLTQ
jgi:hypothetical protein